MDTRLTKSRLIIQQYYAIHALIYHALDYAVYPAQLISLNPAAYIKVLENAPKNIVKRTISHLMIIYSANYGVGKLSKSKIKNSSVTATFTIILKKMGM